MKPNPRLETLKPFIGSWTTAGNHSMMPGVALRGEATFEWHEDAAFVRVRSTMDDPRIPGAVSVIGTDDSTETLTMLYYDVRGVSRRFDVAMEGKVLRWWRMAPGFSQRYVLTIAPGGDTLHGVSSLSKDGSTWEQDMELTYTRSK